MTVDRNALRKIASGDPDAKFAVKRRWLVAVLQELEELDRIRGEHKLGDRFADVASRLTGINKAA